MTIYAIICIPEAELRDLLTRPFHSQGYRVVADPGQARANEEIIATVTPGQTEVLTNSHRLPRGGTVSVTETVRFGSLNVDIGTHQIEMDPLHYFDTAEQFVDHVTGFAQCPGDFLDEVA